MIRTLTPLLVAGAICATAAAQPTIVRRGSPPQPAGVISAPSMPLPGAMVGPVPSPTTPARPLPRPFRPFLGGGLPYYGPWGYSPFWPVWYDTDPVPYVNSVEPVPVPVYTAPPQTTVVLPTPPEEPRARLTLTAPLGSKVWLGGREVDANVHPLVLQSPPLREGQFYTFDVKVTWAENGKTEERTRTVTVAAGDETSLAYRK
jgi:uncharacterized protein (TIGR03000 family)